MLSGGKMNYLSKFSIYFCKKINFSIFVLVCCFTLVQSIQASNHNWVGGNGGHPSTTSCPQNMYAVGMSVKHSRNEIFSLQLLCRIVSGDSYGPVGPVERMPWTRVETDTSSMSVGQVFCKEGVLDSRVAGFTSRYLDIWPVLSGLKFNCVNFTPVFNRFGKFVRVDESLEKRNPVGAKFDSPEVYTGQPDEGEAVNGFRSIQIRSDGALDSIAIKTLEETLEETLDKVYQIIMFHLNF